MQNQSPCVVVLATGGTIAGRARSALDDLAYQSAQLGVQELLHALPEQAPMRLEAEQVAQIDSKDMDHATWQRLARRCAHHLARGDVAGLVVTHGTDTLEETAWFLQRVLAPTKPLALTAAMRPATSAQADGPRNLADALLVAAEPGAAGVVAVLAGVVHAAADVRKLHTQRLDAFDSGDAGPVARIVPGPPRRVLRLRAWPTDAALGRAALVHGIEVWPWVEILTNHAGMRAQALNAWVDAGLRGLVLAGTGNGTVHRDLVPALQQAAARGVHVRLVSRCALGPVLGAYHDWPVYAGLGAPQGRVELLLELLESPNVSVSGTR